MVEDNTPLEIEFVGEGAAPAALFADDAADQTLVLVRLPQSAHAADLAGKKIKLGTSTTVDALRIQHADGPLPSKNSLVVMLPRKSDGVLVPGPAFSSSIIVTEQVTVPEAKLPLALATKQPITQPGGLEFVHKPFGMTAGKAGTAGGDRTVATIAKNAKPGQSKAKSSEGSPKKKSRKKRKRET